MATAFGQRRAQLQHGFTVPITKFRWDSGTYAPVTGEIDLQSQTVNGLRTWACKRFKGPVTEHAYSSTGYMMRLRIPYGHAAFAFRGLSCTEVPSLKSDLAPKLFVCASARSPMSRLRVRLDYSVKSTADWRPNHHFACDNALRSVYCVNAAQLAHCSRLH